MKLNETTRKMPRTQNEAFKHLDPDWSCAVTRWDRPGKVSWQGVGLAAAVLFVVLICLGVR